MGTIKSIRVLVALAAMPVSIAASATTPRAQAGCATCHKQQAQSHPTTSMSNALTPVSSAGILQKHPALKFSSPPFTYTIVREGDRSIYSVTDGKQTLSAPISWAFGLGAAGQTYVYELNGSFYESRVSFFETLQGLDITMGANKSVPKNIEEALGRRMDNKDRYECFSCHATGGMQNLKIDFDQMVPGIQCTNCHKQAEQHLSAIRAGDATKAMAIPRLSKLSTEETSDFCGRCHRTWADIATNGPRDVNNVRFPPYRLTNSKCYDATDKRISCVACHDPHRPSEREAKAYDAKCQACHSPGSDSAAAKKICHTAKSECVTCHMPKFEIPGSHHQFMDHMIRIARQNEAYPY
jgi:hypothetical protein